MSALPGWLSVTLTVASVAGAVILVACAAFTVAAVVVAARHFLTGGRW